MTVAELQAMSASDALTAGWNLFKGGMGTTPYSGTLEASFKSLYRNRLTWFKNTQTQTQINYLVGTLLPWGGAYAAAHPSLGGTVTEVELIPTFEAMQLKSYTDGGGFASNLC